MATPPPPPCHGEQECIHIPACLIRRSTSPASPRDHLMQASGQVRMAAAHLSRFRLGWSPTSPPHRFLIVHKEHGQEALADSIIQLVSWLVESSCMARMKSHDGITVYLADNFIKTYMRGFRLAANVKAIPETGLDSKDVDLIFTMGGDGTVLNAAWMFQQTVPPIMTFHFGTVGFLSMFDFGHHQESIDKIVMEGTRVNIRMRLRCKLISYNPVRSTRFECNVMNEVVVDRGPSPFMALIELYGDDELLTTVLADGLIIATTTGSTAYSMSAGGSVVHPDVPAIMVTPICPHTLSLRPFIIPDSMELTLKLAPQSRSTAWISYDSRSRLELCHEDRLLISSSAYPVTTVCRQNQTKDWFTGLSECLRWNERPGKHP